MRKTILISIAACMLGAMVATSGVLCLMWFSSILRVQEYTVHRDVVMAQETYEFMLEDLDAVAAAKASMDETLAALRGDRRTAGELFGEGALSHHHVHLALLLDDTGGVVAARASSSAGQSAAIPTSLFPHLTADGPLLHERVVGIGKKGLLVLPEGVLMVAARPVAQAAVLARPGPTGTIVVGRYFNDVECGRLAHLIDRPVTLSRWEQMVRSPDRRSRLATLLTTGTLMGPVSRHQTSCYSLLRDIYGRPAAVLCIRGPRAFYQLGVNGLKYLLISLLIAGLVMAAATNQQMKKIVLRRLSRLILDVQQVESCPEPQARVQVEGRDELSGLQRAINRMLGALEQSREGLRGSEERFRHIALYASDWVWELDAEGRHVFCSDRVAQVLGYPTEELLGQPMSELFAADQAERFEHLLRTATQPGTGFSDEDFQAVSREGCRVEIRVSGSPIVNGDGRVHGYRGVGKDVSLQRRAEAAGKLASIGQLAAGVAHEFNNLLGAMCLSADFATLTGETGAYTDLADCVSTCTERGGRVCKNLLRFARPSEPQRKFLPIEAPLEQALTLAAREIVNAEVCVHRSFGADGYGVCADRDELEQVFLNLVINACHAMPDGGHLSVSTRVVTPPSGDTQLQVTVADTGLGIPPENLPRIFEPFFTTKGVLAGGDVEGTGLGLSIVHGIVQSHGGTINVESRVGEGTVFELSFPAQPVGAGKSDPLQARRPMADALSARATCRGSILVADDEPALRALIHSALTHDGYVVTTAADAPEAVAALHRQTFDVVMTDLLMPGGGGENVIQALRQLAPDTPAILMTGRQDAQSAQTLVREHGVRQLAKPFGLEALFEAIHSAGQEGIDREPSSASRCA